MNDDGNKKLSQATLRFIEAVQADEGKTVAQRTCDKVDAVFNNVRDDGIAALAFVVGPGAGEDAWRTYSHVTMTPEQKAITIKLLKAHAAILEQEDS